MAAVHGGVPAHCSVRRSVVPSWGELWQVPLFCLGIFSLVLVWSFRPAHANSKPTAVQAYEKAWLALDLDDVESAKRWLQNLEQTFPEKSISESQLAFLRGSILFARTRQQYPLPVTTPLAKQEYQYAKEVLEKSSNSLSMQEQARLNYRLLIMKLALEGITTAALDQVEQILDIDFADRRDGYQLLSQMRLYVQPADLLGALRAVDRLLASPELTRPNAVRLQKAQLLTQLEKWNEVIKVAHGIPVDAEEYSAALQMGALAAYHLQLWGEAVRAWKFVKEPQQTPSMLLYYGLCQQQLANRTEATKLWERLRITFPGSPESVKATLCLAQLSAQKGRWPDTVSYLVTMLRSQKPEQFHNPYVNTEELWQQVAECAESLIKLHRWEDVRLLAETALPWSQKGQAESWLAQAWHSSAELAVGQNPAPVSQNEAYRLAADNALRAAIAPQATLKEQWLELAGKDALQAQLYPLAQRAYGVWLALPPEPAKRGAVLLGLATALQFQGQLDDARERLREACQIAGEHEASAHLRLYHLLFDQKQWNEAERELELAAKYVTNPKHHPDAAAAAHERLRYLYSLWIINHNEILRAIEAGEFALKYAETHPLAPQTHYFLAELLKADARQLLTERLDDGILRKKAAQFLQALVHFQTAARDLAQTNSQTNTNEPQSVMIRFSRLGQAECYYFLGVLARYAPPNTRKADACWLEAGKIYQDVAAQNDSKLEVINARYWLAQCQAKRGLLAEMHETIGTALQDLENMTDVDFLPPPFVRDPESTRAQWKALLEKELEKNRE